MAFERDPKKLFPHDHLLRYTILPFIPKRVSPNMVTVFRFLGTPVVLYYLWMGNYRVGVPLFLLFASTDAIDGTLARVRKKITSWGTFYDPVADKLLIGSVVLLVVIKLIHPVFALLIVLIELMIVVGGFRMRRKGKLVSANIFGKLKMLFQVTGVSLLLFGAWFGIAALNPIAIVVLSLAIVFAIVSLLTYGI